MKAKKISVILIAVAFSLAIVFSCFFVLLIKKVDVKYSVTNQFDNQEIVDALDVFKDKNLLFIKTEEVYDVLHSYPFVKVIKVEKKYPNILSVEIKERLIVYNLYCDGKTYELDEEGFVVKITNGEVSATRDRIVLELDGLNINEGVLGNKLVLSDNEMFNSMLEMASSVSLTDCIKRVKLVRDSIGEMKDARFETYTGVIITVTKMNILGKDKIDKAFIKYDSADNDYVKSYKEMLVYLTDAGKIQADWIN